MPAFTMLHPVLWTERFDETINFYTDVLGFSVQERNDGWSWAFLQKDKVSIMISEPNAHENFPEIGFTGSFYFKTDDVSQLWEKLRDKAKICYGIETFGWGMREFAIYDNNGYILQFGQPVDEISSEG